jgi:glycosyltransferase involved in cell wall biosynthesis
VIENAKLPCVEIFSSTELGKGAAIKAAAKRSDSEYFAFIDADASPHPDAFISMLERMSAEKLNIIIGSRFHEETISDRTLLRSFSSRVFNILARIIIGISVDDTQCPIKLLDRKAKEVLLSCDDNGWFLDLELVKRVELARLSLSTHPIKWTEFRYPGRRSKLKLASDGFSAVRAMFQLRQRLACVR